MKKKELTELKKELSKLSGVDMFNPKFKDIFKRYIVVDETTTEPDEAVDKETVETTTDTDVEQPTSPIPEDIDGDGEKNPVKEVPQGQGEPPKEVEVTNETESSTETDEPLPTQDEFEATQSAGDLQNELLLTKLELELVRAGIREDRLNTAKRLFIPEFKQSNGNVEQIRQLIAQYPEWVGNKGAKQGFGMPLGQKTDALTAEEKRMKELGMNPRD